MYIKRRAPFLLHRLPNISKDLSDAIIVRDGYGPFLLLYFHLISHFHQCFTLFTLFYVRELSTCWSHLFSYLEVRKNLDCYSEDIFYIFHSKTFLVMFGLYKLVGLTRVSSTGSAYGGSSRNKSS